MIKYVIDCGHGGAAPAHRSTPFGVTGPRGLREKDVTLRLGARLAQHLGAGAVLTRDGDRNLSLGERADVADRHGASVFISIHANGGEPGERGVETWVHERSGEASNRLAQAIQRELSHLSGPDRGVHAGELAVLSPERLPRSTAACLVEVDFLTDPDGERRLGDPTELDSIARAMARAARGLYFGDGAPAADPPMSGADRDRKGSILWVVDLESKLFRLLRENQDTFRAGVLAVVSYWRDFVKEYTRVFTIAQDRKSLLNSLHREEIFTPELLQSAGASVTDDEALRLWDELVNTPRLDSASVDLLMGFLRIVFDTFLDDPTDTNAGALGRSMQILGGDYIPPGAPRGRLVCTTREMDDIRSYFDNRGRTKDDSAVYTSIRGNVDIDPSNPDAQPPFLDPSDPAYTALVKRGRDLWRLKPENPFYQRLERLGLPHGAGISGSAADFVAMGEIAKVSPAEIADYAMAILYFIGLPGHHSFAEIAFVLAGNGLVRFEPRPRIGDYAGVLTDKIKATPAYQRLSEQYPEMLAYS